MTQGERIIDYLEHNSGITPFEAFERLGITKLATRIGELRRNGFDISGRMVKRLNRYGEVVNYMRYSLRSKK